MHTTTTIMLFGLAVAVLPARVAEAQHSEQLTINGRDVAAVSADGRILGALGREETPVPPANDLDLPVAYIRCDSPTASVDVEANPRNPTKLIDTRTKVEIEQRGYPFIRITGVTGGPVVGQPESCVAKVSGFDKDRDGALGGSGDLIKFSLKCKPSLAEEMGLDPTQAAELEAAFGARVTCVGAGAPDL